MSPAQYRRERKARGTQATVAALLGVQRETITRREAGEVEITREMELALRALPKTQPAKPGKPERPK
jgi:DNA-binding XRE family transcriptional regulator